MHFRLLSALLLSNTLVLSGCAPAQNEMGFTISASDIQRADAMQALPGFESATQLADVFKLGTAAPDGEKSEHIVGIIRDILPIETVEVGSLKLTKMWVPILIEVEQSNPAVQGTELILRVFPSSEKMPLLASLKRGERVLAIGVAPSMDETGTFGVSLGWLFEINASGEIVDTTGSSEVLGKFETYADQLGLKTPN